MFIELNYDSSLGSLCPFCGAYLAIDWHNKKEIEYPENTIRYKLYQCSCPHQHISFVNTYIYEDESTYEVRTHIYVFEQDWIDHVGYVSLNHYGLPDQFFDGKMTEEDTLWRLSKLQFHRHPFCQDKNKLKLPDPYRLKPEVEQAKEKVTDP